MVAAQIDENDPVPYGAISTDGCRCPEGLSRCAANSLWDRISSSQEGWPNGNT